jgi:hypothetical protein
LTPRDPRTAEPAAGPDRISIYRKDDAGRMFAERSARVAEEIMFSLEGAIAAADAAARAGEMTADVAHELRDLHALVRQRGLGTSPQGRLV